MLDGRFVKVPPVGETLECVCHTVPECSDRDGSEEVPAG